MLTLTYRGHTLIGVPATHNRAIFAEMVNRICADEATRPAAIAVELDPCATAAAIDWLRELGVAPGGAPLPSMLGLRRSNRRIHPRYREAAASLQRRTGRRLHELPPDLLQRELGYAPIVLLCLSPTDSMVEAMRCALELGRPVYGIDLEHAGGSRGQGPLALKDPLAARGDLPGYVRLLSQQVTGTRDEHVDGRRELAMAARLKALLLQYDRVLWTGGLAHWESLVRLLADERVLPAVQVPQDGTLVYSRVLVDPREAAAQLDIFPRIAAAYEAVRRPASLGACERPELDYGAEFHRCLESAFARYAKTSVADADGGRGRRAMPGYGSYLLRVSLLAQRLVPDLGTALTTARTMMPAGFVQALADALMELDWAGPAQFPGLPILSPDPNDKAGAERGLRRVLLRSPVPSDDDTRPDYTESGPTYVSVLNSGTGTGLGGSHWQWRDEPERNTRDPFAFSYQFVWPPCENLFYATIYEAIHLADSGRLESRSEPYVGALQNGIDLKASLRSVISGKRQIYVKRAWKRRLPPTGGEPVRPAYAPHLELQPTVFLFTDEPDPEGAGWSSLMAGTGKVYEDLSPRGRRLFHAAGGTPDSCFLESLSYGTELPTPPEMEHWVYGQRLLYGAVRFGNPCVNFYQSSVWLEKGRFKAAPIVSGSSGIAAATEMYRQRHGLEIDPDDWANALILLALPYATATRRVAVVCPRTLSIGAQVRHEAKVRGVELVRIPLTHFSNERIERVRRQWSVAAGPGGKTFPPELERLLGQKESAYADLLPPQIRRQARPRPATPARTQTAADPAQHIAPEVPHVAQA